MKKQIYFSLLVLILILTFSVTVFAADNSVALTLEADASNVKPGDTITVKVNFAENTGFVKAMWCGCRECEDKIKEDTGATSRCMPFAQETLSDKCVCCGKPATKMVYWGKAY